MKKAILAHVGIFLLATFFAIGGFDAKARAANGGITISPTSVNKEIAPGASYKGEVIVINQGDVDVTYKVYATPYSVNGEEYKPYFAPVKGATDITDWITFASTGKTLKVGNDDHIAYTITVPKGVGAGSYYGTIFAETEDKGSNGVITRKRVGTVVYIRVSGQAVEKGDIETWSVPWLQKSPLTANLRLANTGSVHFESKVKVTVSDIFGSKKYTYEREPKVLPQKNRKIPVSWQDGASFGLFKVGGEVNYLGKTEKLPTKYVFVANTPMRILTVLILAGFIASVIIVGKKRVAKK
jgi:hypothetical protein